MTLVNRYGFGFLIVLVLLKLVYLGFESYYNINIIELINNPNASQSDFEKFEKFGHTLTATGITLMFLSVFYYYSKKINESMVVRVFITLIPSVILFFAVYSSLEKIMNKIVEINKEYRYEAYYTNIIRQAVLTNTGYYEGIFGKDNIDLNLEDKILLSNVFLLPIIDKDIIERTVGKKDVLVDIGVAYYYGEDRKLKQKEFNDLILNVDGAYRSYVDFKNTLNGKVSKDVGKDIDSTYNQIQQELEKKYEIFWKKSIDFENKLSRETSRSSLDRAVKELNDYFKNKNNSYAERKYKEKMYDKFGRYIDPSNWTYDFKRADSGKVKQTIIHEMYRDWSKSTTLEPKASFVEFKSDMEVRRQVVEGLKKKGLYVSNNFNYTKEEIKNAYWKNASKEKDGAVSSFQKEFEQETGIKNVSMNIKNYEEFVKLFQPQIENMLGNKEFTKKAIELVQKKDSNDFVSMIYNPMVSKEAVNKVYRTREDFETSEYAKIGDDSLKMLYIPPFAIAMSLFAGILNLVSVISILIGLVFYNYQRSIFVLLLIGFIVFPYLQGVESDVFSQKDGIRVDGGFIDFYIGTLKWMVVVEKYNFMVFGDWFGDRAD